MPPCPLCAGAARFESFRAGVSTIHCDRCGQFALGAPARRLLARPGLDRDDRLGLSQRVRAEHNATRVVVMLFTARLQAWLRERAAARQPAEAGPAADAGVARGQQLRQRQAQVVARAARHIDLATALHWRAQETVEEARAARRETRRVRTEALGLVLVARVEAGSRDAIFGVGLQRARRAVGMTQAVLGTRLGRAATWVSAVERGDKRLDAATMRALADAVGCGLDALLTWPEQDEKMDAPAAERD